MEGLGEQAMRVVGIWRSILVVVLCVLASGLAIAHGVSGFPVLILFADLLVFWHVRLLADERRREVKLDKAAFHAAAVELGMVKAQHRDRLAPAQGALPFNQWVAEIRGTRQG